MGDDAKTKKQQRKSDLHLSYNNHTCNIYIIFSCECQPIARTAVWLGKERISMKRGVVYGLLNMLEARTKDTWQSHTTSKVLAR